MGIIENFKRHHRKLVVRRLLHNIDNKDMDWKPNLLDAIHMTTAAWNQVPPETITKCFRKCCGDSAASDPRVESHDDCDTEDPDDDILRERIQLDPSLTFTDYLNVNREVATGETETEESILVSLRGSLNEENEEQNDEFADESTEPEAPSMSNSEDLMQVREPQSYFTKLENARQEDFPHLSAMEMFLLKQSCSNHQSSITNFFKPTNQ